MFYDPRTEKHGLKHSPVTSLVIPRPIGWVSTIGPKGKVNLAPYSFFNMVSGHPPWLMFSSAPKKNSQTNAEICGEFTFSLATWSLREVMNQSSAEYPDDVSEPEAIGIEMAECRNVKTPRVAKSPVAIECKYNKTVDLIASDGKQNRSHLVIGEVVGIHIDESIIVDGMLDVRKMQPIARMGYMDYCVVNDYFSMARPGEYNPRD
jgi:flavin reductase (DIM6/NTAB) family NADH-FMN oxidoreductase RutF